MGMARRRRAGLRAAPPAAAQPQAAAVWPHRGRVLAGSCPGAAIAISPAAAALEGGRAGPSAAWLRLGSNLPITGLRRALRPQSERGPASPGLLHPRPSSCWKMDSVETEFNLKVVLVSFKQCLTEEGEVLLDHYIDSWKGLVRFLNSLGTVFSFISKDVVSKLQIMEHLRSSPQREHYTSLQSMVAYEVGNKLVDLDRHSRSRYPNSGCRTVLRLHRALHWLQLFLEGLRTSSEDARTSTLCSDSYNTALAAYHSWIVRQAVTVAFCALPTRKVFLESMKVGSPEQAVEMLGEALPFIELVYDTSQKLLAEHGLLDLP